MSADSNADKNIEKISKPHKTESRLDNPDAQEAREADKKTISEIGEQNPDNWMSAEGQFAIVDESHVLASRDVTEEKTVQAETDFDKQNLSEELQAIKISGNPVQAQLAEQIQEMRSAAKEKGLATTEIDKFAKETFSSEGQDEQFQRGAFKPLPSTDQPVGGYEQENRADGGITLKGVIPGEIENENQLDEIGKLLLTGAQEYLEEQKERALGATIGTVESIGELTMDFVNIAEFVGDVIVGNKDRAAEKGAQFGDALGKTLVGGVNVFKAAHKYLYDIGFEGDYSKPFRDVVTLGTAIDREWTKLPPKEQERLKYKLATDVIAGAIPIGGATKITKAQKLTTALEEAAVLGNELKHGEKASKSISELVKELFERKKPIKVADKVEDSETGLASIIDDIEKQLAGAPGGKWDVVNERFADDVTKQLRTDSCYSACVEMVTNGAINQSTMIELAGAPTNAKLVATKISSVLDTKWKGGFIEEVELDDMLKHQKPWIADFRTPYSGKLSHTVVVDGLNQNGLIKIKDPWDGTKYEMTRKEFERVWTGISVFDTR